MGWRLVVGAIIILALYVAIGGTFLWLKLGASIVPAASEKWAELLSSKYPFDQETKEGIIRGSAKTVWVYGRVVVTELPVSTKGYLTVENKYGKFTGKAMREAPSAINGGESELSRLGIKVGDLIRVKMINDANFPVILEVQPDK